MFAFPQSCCWTLANRARVHEMTVNEFQLGSTISSCYLRRPQFGLWGAGAATPVEDLSDMHERGRHGEFVEHANDTGIVSKSKHSYTI